ncbi:MAG: hypothetical protein JOZ51_08410 [Chloroflexi bacterium]|nr:hypothetical protein [Chloroflexota bacterium]
MPGLTASTVATAAVEPIAANATGLQVLQTLQHQGIQAQLEGESRIEWLLPKPGIGSRLTENLTQERLYLHVHPDIATATAKVASIPKNVDTDAIDWIDVPYFF